MPTIARARVPMLLLLGPPTFGALLAGMVVGVARKLVEHRAPATDFVVLLSIASVATVALTFFLNRAARVRRGGATQFPRLWRSVPWTAAAGFVFGAVVAGTHALLK